MSRIRSKKSGRRVRGDAYSAPYFSQNAPMEVYDGSGYREDPAIHSTDVDPERPKPKAPEAATTTEIGDSERNEILTSPLPMVVSAPEAIEKMEKLNELVQEGRPDLARESEAVAQAIEVMERKALGEADFEQHEAAEGHDAATGLPAQQAPAFSVGDRVVMALDDGDYQGEVQKDNGDGTYDIKTDQMATFRRVPAESIAKPDMLQPVASGEKKTMKKAPRKKTVSAAAAADPAKPAAVAASVAVKAAPEGYTLVDGVRVVEENGHPRAFDETKDDTVPADLYVNGEGKLALVGPDGEMNFEDKENDEVEFDYWKQVHGLIPPKQAAKPDTEVPPAPAPQPAPTEPAKEAVAASAAPEEKDEAQRLLAEHKVSSDKFFVVANFKGKGGPVSIQASDLALLRAGLEKKSPEPILGIFSDQGAAERFAKIVGGNKTAEDALDRAQEEIENAEVGITMTRVDIEEMPQQAREAAAAVARSAEEAARLADEAKNNIEGSKVVASGIKSELAKDPTFAAVMAGLKAPQDAVVEILASKDGIVTARVKGEASEPTWHCECPTDLPERAGSLRGTGTHPMSEDRCEYCKVTREEAINGPAAAPSVEASAFDEIPELEIGGGMVARRKKGKGEKGEGKAEIEVVDKDGKSVATYPDAFGEDTVMIIKFLRQLLDIKEADDKKAAAGGGKDEGKGGEKKDKGGESAAEKPVALPDARPPKEKASEADDKAAKDKEKEKGELEARARWMEARVADARTVVEAMLRKGHVSASQEDIDAELLTGKTLRQAQEVAARKAVDRQVMHLLAKPEAELLVIKASLPHLKVRQVKVQASEGGIDLAHLSASGLIHEKSRGSGSLGVAISATFHR